MADAEPQDVLMWMLKGSADTPGHAGDIIGESRDKDAGFYGAKAFELTEFSLKAENATNVGSSTGGGAGAGKVKFDRLSCKKYSDRATPQLLHGLANGSTYMDVWIQLRSNNRPYIVMHFTQCLLSELEFSQSGEDQAEDSFVIDWGSFELTYHEDPGTGDRKPIEPAAVWSRVLNEAVDAIE